MFYLIDYLLPPSRLAVDEDITQWSTSGRTISDGGTYLISASTAGFVNIDSVANPSTVNGTNGISVVPGTPLYIYIRPGQKIKFSANTGTYVRVERR